MPLAPRRIPANPKIAYHKKTDGDEIETREIPAPVVTPSTAAKQRTTHSPLALLALLQAV